MSKKKKTGPSKSKIKPASRPGRQVPVWTPPRWALAVAIGVILLIVLRTAWQSDDAFITFRTARNFWSGEGLVWNPGERVQSYSNPLWLLVAILCHGLFGEVYFSVIFVSIAIAGVNLALIAYGFCRVEGAALLALMALSVSAAVIDYATSGLENGALALLLLLFLAQLRREASPWRLSVLALLAALLALTRLDALLFAAPALAREAWLHRAKPMALARAALGFLPLILWELFSLVYYGSLVPNTAYAKLNVAIPKLEMIGQGLTYLGHGLTHDPVSMALIIGGLAAAWRFGSQAERWFALGVALYLPYIAWIGGDFMAGRFLAAPAWAGAALLACRATPETWRALTARRRYLAPVAVAVLSIYGLAWPQSRWFSGADYGAGMSFAEIVGPSGIADERAYYYPTTGLAPVWGKRAAIRRNDWPTPPYPAAIRGRELARSDQRAVVTDEVGFFGYFAGPDKAIMDIWALCDPLLARLPFEPKGAWRVGHYRREVPKGYRESFASGTNRFEDPEMADFYEAIRLATRGPLFTGERWRAIWRLHTGHYRAVAKRASSAGSGSP